MPLAPRRALEISFDHVETHAPDQVFEIRQITDEGSIALRAALSDFAPLPGDGELGIEARRASRATLFGGATVATAAADVFQAFVDYDVRFTRPCAQGQLNLAVHASPGGVGQEASDAAYRAYSQGRLHSSTYAYVTVGGEANWRLPSGFALKTDLAAQYAYDALPETEQAPLGGPGAVRGYSLDDGAFDSNIVLRTELATPQIAVRLPAPGYLQPYLLADGGWGQERRGGSHAAYAAGLGLTYQVARMTASADGACALHDAAVTRCGECRLEARLAAAY
jgi:hemolysin activation/secretion protein